MLWYCLDRMVGRLLTLPKACVTMGELSVRMVVPMAMKKLRSTISKCLPDNKGYAYPNVAADPIMYCPSVLSIPFGPGPNRTMFVKPGSLARYW